MTSSPPGQKTSSLEHYTHILREVPSGIVAFVSERQPRPEGCSVALWDLGSCDVKAQGELQVSDLTWLPRYLVIGRQTMEPTGHLNPCSQSKLA